MIVQGETPPGIRTDIVDTPPYPQMSASPATLPRRAKPWEAAGNGPSELATALGAGQAPAPWAAASATPQSVRFATPAGSMPSAARASSQMASNGAAGSSLQVSDASGVTPNVRPSAPAIVEDSSGSRPERHVGRRVIAPDSERGSLPSAAGRHAWEEPGRLLLRSFALRSATSLAWARGLSHALALRPDDHARLCPPCLLLQV
jgi:hypothetical protein